MVVLIHDGRDGLVQRDPRLTDRMIARVRAAHYDRRLAAGEPPESDVRMALRAQHLVSSDTRRWLVRSLNRLLAEAGSPMRPGATPPLTPQCRRRLIAARDAVAEVIHELQRPAPVSSQGVAALCCMMRDGQGPLYGQASTDDLRRHLGHVREELVPLNIW
jgi:hypothetical protein